jgi:ankyrin repeat protein
MLDRFDSIAMKGAVMKSLAATFAACLVIASGVARGAQKEVSMPQGQVDEMLGAIRAGDRASVERLLAANPALAGATAPNGASALLWTAYTGHPELAPVFVAHGAQVELWDAAAMGNLARVKELVTSKPAAVNAVAPDGFFALGLAAFFGHADIVAWLLDHGANVNQAAANSQRVTALHAAVARGNVPLARMLLEHGADANVKQESGLAPLHEAAANGNSELVRLLVDHGAAIDQKTDAGKTAADFAADRNHAELGAWLRDRAPRQ